MSETRVPLDRDEMLRRRAARSRYRFKLYRWEEMCWFSTHPTEWNEECTHNGIDLEESPEDRAVREIVAMNARKAHTRYR